MTATEFKMLTTNQIVQKKKASISAEAFVRIWQRAESIHEVMQKTGLQNRQCWYRSKKYRAKGVPLKKMIAPRNKVNWERLKQIALESVENK